MLAGDISTPPHRTHDATVEKGSTAACGFPLALELNRSDVLVGDSVVRGVLVGNSLDDEERSDNLLATTIRQPSGAHRGRSRASTNLNLIEDWPEDVCTLIFGNRQRKKW